MKLKVGHLLDGLVFRLADLVHMSLKLDAEGLAEVVLVVGWVVKGAVACHMPSALTPALSACRARRSSTCCPVVGTSTLVARPWMILELLVELRTALSGTQLRPSRWDRCVLSHVHNDPFSQPLDVEELGLESRRLT